MARTHTSRRRTGTAAPLTSADWAAKAAEEVDARREQQQLEDLETRDHDQHARDVRAVVAGIDRGAQHGEFDPVARAVLAGDQLERVPLDQLTECSHNPRRRFDETAMAQLIDSVRQHGVLTPLLVRDLRGDAESPGLIVAAGHRRLRAARAAGLADVPCILRRLTHEQFVELLNLENLQRRDLDALEEAEGFRQLLALPGRSVETVAAAVSRSPKYVYDRVRLLDLVDEAQALLIEGRITPGHGILIARLNVDQQRLVLDERRGGLWEYEVLDVRGIPTSGLFDDQESEPISRTAPRRRPVSVRQLDSWIDAHLRFDRARVDPMDAPETASTLFAAQQAEQPLQVVEITHLHQVPETARGGEKILCRGSWRRADGEIDRGDPRNTWTSKPSKTCEYSVFGVLAVGPDRGEAFQVCTAKKACKVHWSDHQRPAKVRAGVPGGAKQRESNQAQEEQRKRAEAQRALEEKAWTAALPEIRRLGEEAVAKASAAPGGPLEPVLRPYGMRPIKGKTAEDLVRALAAHVLLRDAWSIKRGDHQKQLAALGVPVKALVAAELKKLQTFANPEHPKEGKTMKKKSDKKTARRARKGRAHLGSVLVLLALVLALAGCGSTAGWRQVASTVELGAGHTDHAANDALGNSLYSDSSQIWVTVRPLAFLAPPTQVVIVKREGE